MVRHILNIITIIMIPLYIATVVSCGKSLVLENKKGKETTDDPNGGDGSTIFLIKNIVSSKTPELNTVSMNESKDIYSLNVSDLKKNDKVLILGNYNLYSSDLEYGVLESYIREDEESISTNNKSFFNKKLKNTNVNLIHLDSISSDVDSKKYFIHLNLTSNLDANLDDDHSVSILENTGEIQAFIYSKYKLEDFLSGKYNEDNPPYYLASYYNTSPSSENTITLNSENRTLQSISSISLKKGDYIHVVGQNSIDMKACIVPPETIQYDFMIYLTSLDKQGSVRIADIKRNYVFTNYDTISFSNIYKVEEEGMFSVSSSIKLEEEKECGGSKLSTSSNVSVYVFRNAAVSSGDNFYYLKYLDSKTSDDIIADKNYKQISSHSESKKENEESLLSFNIPEVSKDDILDIRSNFFVYQLEEGKNYQLYSKYDIKCGSGNVSSLLTGGVFRKASDFNGFYHSKMNFSNYYSLKTTQSFLPVAHECEGNLKFLGYSTEGSNPFYLYGIDSIVQHWKYSSKS